jgi:hypothetical protein
LNEEKVTGEVFSTSDPNRRENGRPYENTSKNKINFLFEQEVKEYKDCFKILESPTFLQYSC